MAGLFWTIDPAPQLSGAATKTFFQIVAPANHRVHLHEISISVQGITAADPPLLFEVLVQSTAGTASNNGVSPLKLLDSDPETVQTTYNWTYTVEPTAGNIKFSEYVHPQGGTWFWQPPPAIWPRGFPIQGGTRVGIRITTPGGTTSNTIVRCLGEE